jgi:hypothetical protein
MNSAETCILPAAIPSHFPGLLNPIISVYE